MVVEPLMWMNHASRYAHKYEQIDEARRLRFVSTIIHLHNTIRFQSDALQKRDYGDVRNRLIQRENCSVRVYSTPCYKGASIKSAL